MAPMSLPPGFRFHPTDEELVGYYLDRKICGGSIELEIIPEVDLYKCEPWDLPEKSLLPSKDMEWYFYSPRDKKYPNGSRTNRATRGGYWKATGKDRAVQSYKRPVPVPMGMKKTLVYYKGRAPHGIRTNWVMHEYRLLHTNTHSSPSLKDSYALCRVLKKSIEIPKRKEDKTDDIEKELVSIGDDDELGKLDMEEENCKMNKLQKHVSKSDTSSSDVTQATPTETAFDNFQAPFTSDEANSSTAHNHFHSYFGLNFPSSTLIQDIEMSSLNYQVPYPALEFDDYFPEINILSASSSISSETRATKPESNIDEFINMYDHNKYCKGRDNLNGALEDIFSLCSSQEISPIPPSMQH